MTRDTIVFETPASFAASTANIQYDMNLLQEHRCAVLTPLLLDVQSNTIERNCQAPFSGFFFTSPQRKL